MRYTAFYIILTLMLIGCTVGRGTGIFPPAAGLDASPPLSLNDDGSDYRILVANGLSETLTLVERIDGTWTVTPDIIETGQAPNHMVIRNDVCYIVNSLSNSIQFIDIDNFQTIREISTGAGTNPMFIDFVDDSTAIVTCYISNEAVLIDLDPETNPENHILSRISMPYSEELPHDDETSTNARPGAVVVIDDKAYVACSNLMMYHTSGGPGVLVRIDLPSRSIDSSWKLIGRDTTGLIHSSRFPDRLIIISAGDHEIATGFTGNGVVESLDLNTGEIFQVIELENGAPFNGVIGPNDVLILENGQDSLVLSVDLREGSNLPGYELPTYGEPLSFASSLLALPGLILVTNFNADRLYLIDPVTRDVLAELATGDGPDAMVLIF